MDYYIYIIPVTFHVFSIYVFVFWHTFQMAELPYLSEDTICIICICAGQQHFSSPNLVQQRKLSTLAVKPKVFKVLATVFRTP